MKRSLAKLAVAVSMLVALVFVDGCDSNTKIGKEQAIAVAKQEAIRRGWKEVETGSAVFENERWVVMVERLPKVVGGHAFVEVSTNGKTIRFTPGK